MGPRSISPCTYNLCISFFVDNRLIKSNLPPVKYLKSSSFSIDALELVNSYLSDRWHRTKVNNSYSSWEKKSPQEYPRARLMVQNGLTFT